VIIEIEIDMKGMIKVTENLLKKIEKEKLIKIKIKMRLKTKLIKTVIEMEIEIKKKTELVPSRLIKGLFQKN